MASSDDEIPDLLSGSARSGRTSEPEREARKHPAPPRPSAPERAPNANTTGFELEVLPHEERAQKATRILGTALDEMEFDPMASQGNSLESAPMARASERPPGGSVGLELDYRAPAGSATGAAPLMGPGESTFDDDLEFGFGGGAGPSGGPVALSSIPTLEIPDLVAERRASEEAAAQRSAAARAAAQRAAQEQRRPSVSPAARSSRPPPSSEGSDLVLVATADGGGKHGAFDAAGFPGLGGEVELGGGLDDLDFGGAQAAQLNVAIPMPSKDDEVPWPTGVTPWGDELAVDPQEAIKAAGFGPAPTSIFQTPMYAWRASNTLRDLRDRTRLAKEKLDALEQGRDERLAMLGEELRAELSKNPRFEGLFANIERHDEEIRIKRLHLEHADVEGAGALRNVQAEIDNLTAERQEKQALRDQKRAYFEEVNSTLERAQAGLRRIEIQWRNVEARAAQTPGKEMPPELDAILDRLEPQKTKLEAVVAAAKVRRKEAANLLESAENEVRIRLAALQRAEGQKEGLLIAYEGDVARHARELDAALLGRLRELSTAARAILDLRGEVPVSGDVRRELLDHDRAVKEAAISHATLVRGADSMDKSGYQTGKVVGIGGALVLVALLLLAAIL